MSNPTRRPHELDPRGPEGVPLDAPGNEGPALSPHAVSRMHRSEDDQEAFTHSPEFSDERPAADEHQPPQQERWVSGAPGSGGRHDASDGLDSQNTRNGDPNPSHHTGKRDTTPPRGRGDGELMEQPGTTSEARQPGVDSPRHDD